MHVPAPDTAQVFREFHAPMAVGGMASSPFEREKTFLYHHADLLSSAKLHIGHTYCTVATDAMARYKRLQGYDVMS